MGWGAALNTRIPCVRLKNYAGHDPADYRHLVNDPETDLSLHPNSPGYRLILNNILFPAAKKKKRKT